MSPRGRTRITTRALTRLISAVSAEALAVTAAEVTVELTDAAGRLAVHVRSAIRIGSLTGGNTAGHRGPTVLDRAERAQEHIRRETGRLTGTDVAHVTVQLSGAIIRPEGRVL